MRRLAVFLLALLLLLPFPARAEQIILLTFAGDVTLGSEENVRDHEASFDSIAAREGYGYFFEKMLPLFQSDDLTVVNLEGVLSDSARGGNAGKGYRFRGPAAMTQVLQLGSIEAVNLANNHTQDYGKTGFSATVAALDAAGVGSFAQKRVFLWEKGNVKLAFFGLNSSDFYRCRAWFRTEIPRLKSEEGVDAVIFTFHGGYEYRPTHNPRQAEYARTAIDAGADLVIMHHPHVLQGMEVYRSRSIFYSLGNFCFGGNKSVRVNETAAIRAALHFDDEGRYLGQQMTICPAHISGTSPANNFQPCPVTGQAALAVM